MGTSNHEPLDAKVTRLVMEYAQDVPASATASACLDPALSLRGDLAVDSLSLVSLMVRLGEELGVMDLEEWGAELAKLQTVGDLVGFGEALQKSTASQQTMTGT